LLILLKAIRAVLKGFLKAAGSHGNRFPQVAEVENFHKFGILFAETVGILFMCLLMVFGNPSIISLAALKSLFQPMGFKQENIISFGKIRRIGKRLQRSARKSVIMYF
jgi:hypothetical protein